MEVISVSNIAKKFATVEVLNDISFSVSSGEVVSIIGPSGSGKSTLLRCIANLETVDTGSIIIGGMQLVKTTVSGKAQYADKKTIQNIRRQVGLVFQNFNLFPHFSVMRNIIEAPIHVLG
ncbi:MAG: amino acid ABC transporter ATP-binding protein, partial [Spirochaetales bacterium]|nr:amino acid ABC transporter ATP-binding protein [Spirochaetales bacterium]